MFSLLVNRFTVEIAIHQLSYRHNRRLRFLQNSEHTRFKRFFSKIGFLRLKTVLQEPQLSLIVSGKDSV
jgi:hypothetical protein